MSEFRRDGTIIAHRIFRDLRLDPDHSDEQWDFAEPTRFSADWRGQSPDPELETEVRLLWSPSTLYLRFLCRYRKLFFFDGSEPNGRRDQLWERDVAEAFLQPSDLIAKSRPGQAGQQSSASRPYAFYKEFEVAPNGLWIDLDISPSGLADLKSGLTRSVHINQAKKTWAAEMAIPMDALTANFDPDAVWRANFFRVEGKTGPRSYMAWLPTHTPQPNFHIPQAFGILKFEP